MACALHVYTRQVLLNSPSWAPLMWRLISTVLPQSVKAKVKILGTDYYKELEEDLGEEVSACLIT